jgi:hypothetical protein
MEVSSVLGRVLSMGGSSCLTEALRSLAMEFLAKVRVEVDRVIFFGLGLKINTLTDIRRRLGRVFSRLGLKPKLLHGLNLKGRHMRLTMRGLNLGPAVALVKANGGGKWIPDSDLGQGKVSSEKTEEEAVLVTSGGDDVVMGSGVAGFDEAVAPSGKGVVSPSEEYASAKVDLGPRRYLRRKRSWHWGLLSRAF